MVLLLFRRRLFAASLEKNVLHRVGPNRPKAGIHEDVAMAVNSILLLPNRAWTAGYGSAAMK